MNKMITVLMSVYKERLEWLQQAVESILAQSYKDLEFIIIIDNPELAAEARSYLEAAARRDSRMKLLTNPKNIGLANSMNRALAQATGKYIARMDADDISLPDRLETELRELQKRNADMVSCLKVIIDGSGEVIGEDEPVVQDPYKYLLYGNVINHPSVLMRADVLRSLGGYRDFSCSQDYDLWLRMLTGGYKISVVNQHLLRYRLTDVSITGKKAVQQFYSAEYQRSLYRERVKTGRDSFSPENYQHFIERKTKGIKQSSFLEVKELISQARKERDIKKFFKAFVRLPDYTMRKTKLLLLRSAAEKSLR